MRPHRVKYWLNAKPADPREFASQVRTVCEVYRDAIALFERHGVHTVSIDEQTGIQALERIASDKLPRPGQVARLEYEYRRHGTTGLFGNLHIATGRILSPLVRQTRTEDDFVENIDNLVRHIAKQTHPSWIIRVNNGSGTTNPVVHRLLQRHDGSSLRLDLQWAPAVRLENSR